ncbi:type III-B CRISPR module-associated protein Cmr3 [Aggregatilineales bacterium SYSU G02658]
MTQWIFIEQNDVWMFRDNKPFTAAADFLARSIFPPTPQTVQGAIRTAYLTQQGISLKDFMAGRVDDPVIGSPAKLGALQIHGPYVARRVNGKLEALYPMPMDVLKRTNKDTHKLEVGVLKPSSQEAFATNAPFEGWRPLAGGGDGFKEASGFLTAQGMADYLKGQAPAVEQIVETSAVYTFEDRVGLALDRGRRANRQGHFYRAQFVRMQTGAGLLVGLEGGQLDASGVLYIGGESRTGCYETVKFQAPPAPKEGRLKVVLLAPAWFENVYHTDWSPFVGGGKLVSVVLGKPQPISGWDVAHNRPKPLRNFIPMGSVFYFEGGAWQNQPFTQTPDDQLPFGAMGFGTCVVGTW